MNTMIEMYDRIMSVVEEVTGISKDKILTSKLHFRIRMVVKDPNGVTPMSCLKRLSNMMVGLNVNLTTTNGHCMLQ